MNQATLDTVLAQVRQLSPLDKVRLVEQVMAILEEDLQEDQPKKPRRSLLGMWEGVSISAEDIDEARQEMWGNFPREDI
jgi:hypothetical protein